MDAAIAVDSPRELVEWSIKQDAIYGFALDAIAFRNHTSIEDVELVLSASPEFRNTAGQRKKLALARLDLATKALMPALVKGELPAIHTYLKVQEREAKLTGMDSPVKQDSIITIDVPWLTRERLAYKDADGEIVENVTDIRPAIEVKKAVAEAWKSPPPDEGLGYILRDADKPK